MEVGVLVNAAMLVRSAGGWFALLTGKAVDDPGSQP